MAKKAYSASGKLGDGALPILFGGAALAGVGAGLVVGIVSIWFSLLILFPLLVGGLAGAAGTKVIDSRHVRAPALALMAGLLAGGVGQLMTHVVAWQYLAYQIPDQSVGFMEYLDFAAERGVAISHHGRKTADLQDNWYWALFGAEFLLAMGAGGLVMFQRAREPYCENCQRWYGAEQAIGVSNGEKPERQATLAALARDEQIVVTAPTPKAALVFAHRSCPQCQEAEPLLIVKAVALPNSKKPQVRNVYESLVSRSYLQQLQSTLGSVTTDAS